MLPEEGMERNVEPVRSPWREMLLTLVGRTRQNLFIACPYIKEAVVEGMEQALRGGRMESQEELAVRIITRLDGDDLLSGASDIQALQRLLAWNHTLERCHAEMRIVPNLHAKVWIVDGKQAIVGSGNATPSGWESNLEYGISLREPTLVEEIERDWNGYWSQAEPISAETLDAMAQALRALKESEEIQQIREAQKQVRKRLHTLPSVGRRIVVTERQKPDKNSKSVLREQKVELDQPNQQEYQSEPGNADNALDGSQLILDSLHTIEVKVEDAWRAYRWVVPSGKLINSNQGALKLAWQKTENSGQLRFIWTDATRHSEAVLESDSTTNLPWSYVFMGKNLQLLGDQLQLRYTQGQELIRLLWEEQGHILWLTSDQEQGIKLPGIVANIPDPFPSQRSPVSTIRIPWQDLSQAYKHLSDQMTGNIVEITVARDHLVLKEGKLASQLTESVPAKPTEWHGPETRLRLARKSLEHVIQNEGFGEGLFREWHVSIGRGGDTIQFRRDEDGRTWRHELRHV